MESALPLVQLLRQHWGNTDYTAGPRYLLRVVKEAQRLPEHLQCVECGSGLTTSALCTVLPHSRLMSLEDRYEWLADVRLRPNVNGVVHHAPLKDYGGYQWYGDLPDFGTRKVGLVICDGPRGDAKGGRYGALPQLMPVLAERFTVLLDDVQRAGEMGIAARWREEYGLTMHVEADSDGRRFAVLRRGET